MSFQVKSQRLESNGRPVTYIESPNRGGNLRPLYLIMHYTAGGSAEGAISWFKDPRAKASAHLVIGRDGEVTQMVPFNRVAWHAGRSSWNELEGMNSYAIGIELANAGKLRKNEQGDWVNWASNKVPPAEVTVATHKDETTPAGWQLYTSEQLEAALGVAMALHEAYRFLDILGHEDVSPRRKVDPGPAFPMISFKSKVLGRQ
ncbi:N-acetylmuramoyl-L-alanine amidase [Microvirga puerhi]|uniref:N-acetylmuramoyl-L-alanine amidase n=1 Tax=Microvirga puerhi TaxID=2876078 RepID=A0ABS7VM71_9HYPH|nr:N-acetylmuramoyl-L-alanine amidase [Microvirga puerhi]MBZ6076329.1 N-acetylmuramoyl-L-alanine amidase [Microvirga puerhi]